MLPASSSPKVDVSRPTAASTDRGSWSGWEWQQQVETAATSWEGQQCIGRATGEEGSRKIRHRMVGVRRGGVQAVHKSDSMLRCACLKAALLEVCLCKKSRSQLALGPSWLCTVQAGHTHWGAWLHAASPEMQRQEVRLGSCPA